MCTKVPRKVSYRNLQKYLKVSQSRTSGRYGDALVKCLGRYLVAGLKYCVSMCAPKYLARYHTNGLQESTEIPHKVSQSRAVAIGTAVTAMAVPVFGLKFTFETRLCSARYQILAMSCQRHGEAARLHVFTECFVPLNAHQPHPLRYAT